MAPQTSLLVVLLGTFIVNAAFLRNKTRMEQRKLSSKASDRFFVNTLPDWPQEPDSENPKKENDAASMPSDQQNELFRNSIKEIIAIIEEKSPPLHREQSDASIYTGVGGVAFMFLRLYQKFKNEEYLRKAESYIRCALRVVERKNKDSKREMTFITGAAGVYSLASVIFKELGREEKCETYLSRLGGIYEKISPSLSKEFGEWELLYGAGGYIYALYFAAHHLKTDMFTDIAKELIRYAFLHGQWYAKKVAKRMELTNAPPLMYAWHGKEYLAMAHGLTGILQVFLLHPENLPQDLSNNEEEREEEQSKGKSKKQKTKKKKKVEPLELIHQCIEWLLTIKLASGNYPTKVGGESDVLVQWCHGSPAVGLLLTKAYDTWRDERYVEETRSIADVVWQRGLLKKGVGICHGVSGNGYVFLYLYRLTKDPKYLHRALQFGEFGVSKKCREEAWPQTSKPYSLFNGLAGAVCYMADLLTSPTECCFPAADLLS